MSDHGIGSVIRAEAERVISVKVNMSERSTLKEKGLKHLLYMMLI